jgi:peptidoglycan-associated lipoprotein
MKYHLKYLTGFMAILLLAACETAPQGAGDGSSSSVSGEAVDFASEEITGEFVDVQEGVAPGSQDDLVTNVGDRVLFDTDSSVVNSDGQRILERQAAWLQNYPYVYVVVEGHCDERGTREYNLALGERRADAMKKYLVSLGIDSSRIATVSYGKERPAVIGSTAEAWVQNRRGVTVVSN